MARRPTQSKYTPALEQEICERLSDGEPLAVICRDKHMPSVTTVWTWQRQHRGVAENIARARETGWDRIAWSARNTARGQGDSTGDVQRDKLIIETDLKLLAKWDSKRYGDKVAVVGGGEGDAPIQSRVEVVFVAVGQVAPVRALEALEALEADESVALPPPVPNRN